MGNVEQRVPSDRQQAVSAHGALALLRGCLATTLMA
jgi:hypothetical protein